MALWWSRAWPSSISMKNIKRSRTISGDKGARGGSAYKRPDFYLLTTALRLRRINIPSYRHLKWRHGGFNLPFGLMSCNQQRKVTLRLQARSANTIGCAAETRRKQCVPGGGVWYENRLRRLNGGSGKKTLKRADAALQEISAHRRASRSITRGDGYISSSSSRVKRYRPV